MVLPLDLTLRASLSAASAPEAAVGRAAEPRASSIAGASLAVCCSRIFRLPNELTDESYIPGPGVSEMWAVKKRLLDPIV